MAVVQRGSVAEPTLPKQTVEVEALGGEVVVRGLLLVERLAMNNKLATMRAATRDRAAGAPYDPEQDLNIAIPMLLALCVLDADGVPLWSEQQWQVFGGQHQNQALALFNVAWDLSGLNEGAQAKN